MIHIEYFTVNAFMERCSIVWDEQGNCAFIDPGFENAQELAEATSLIQKKGLKPVCILLTHGHFDHVLGAASIAAEYGNLPIYMHPADKVTLENNSYFSKVFGVRMPDAFTTSDISEGNVVEVGSLRFEVIETPGHTPGGVCYLERNEKVLFSGDTLFAGSIGRTDHPGGDYDALMKGIFEKLMELDGDIKVIPGHGPESEIAQERTTNPFLQPFNEPYEN
jgi:glyoxylase-like metal-dependent hydrolase (beta-lactamase superfamily II)